MIKVTYPKRVVVDDMSMTEAREILYERAKAEQDEFVEELLKLPPDKILNAAYEKMIRDDMLYILEGDELTDEEILALLTVKAPLAVCYGKWVDGDASYMDILYEHMRFVAKRIINDMKGRKQYGSQTEKNNR